MDYYGGTTVHHRVPSPPQGYYHDRPRALYHARLSGEQRRRAHLWASPPEKRNPYNNNNNHRQNHNHNHHHHHHVRHWYHREQDDDLAVRKSSQWRYYFRDQRRPLPSRAIPTSPIHQYPANGCDSDMRLEMIEDEFDKYFARAALGRAIDDDIDAEEGRRGSLPSSTLKVIEPSGCRRSHSCKYPSTRRKRSISPRPSNSGSPKHRPSSLLIDNANGSSGDAGEGSDDSSKNLLSDNYIHEATLRAPSPGIKCHSAPHSRSSSWKKNRRPRAGSRQDDLFDQRPRTGSIPLEETVISKLEKLKMLQSDDVCPVRSFAISSKGLINRGDSFKRRSEQSVASEGGASNVSTGSSKTKSQETVAEPVKMGTLTSITTQPRSKATAPEKPVFKVLIIGDHGVGKTALLNQFMTSDYMGASDTSFDTEGEITVSVVLDGEETTMDFIDVPSDEKFQTYGKADAYVVAFSITDRSSYLHAIELLNQIQSQSDMSNSAIILVANKSELVRSRQVGDNEIKEICEARNCKFIEVSAVLNHKVDELLVGVVSQIRFNPQRADRRRLDDERPRESSCVTSAKGLLGKLFRRTQYVSKSCDNLMVL